MIDIENVKNRILELAYQGQLVPHVTSEGAAKDIIDDMPNPSAKRKRLLAEGRSDEPYELPETWAWVRLGIITSYGDTPNKVMANNAESSTWILELEDIEAGGKLLKKSRVGEKSSIGEKTSFKSGQVLYSKLRPYLKKALIADEDGICTPELIAFDTFEGVDPKYVMRYLISPYVDKLINQRSYGIKMPRVDSGFMVNLSVPLPPLKEQERITKSIDEIFDALGIIDDLQEQYANDREALKSKLIDAGIQGKLSEQLPEDGTAEDLRREAIKFKEDIEKQGLLKNRKNKDVKEVNTSDYLYDLPESWRWFRLGEIAEVFGRIGFRGYKKTDLVQKGQGAITMSPSNISKGGDINFDDSTYISWEKYEESPEIMLEEGDVVLVKTGSTYGKSGIIESLPEKATINPQLAILKYIQCNRKYLAYVLRSSAVWTQYESFVVGAATPTFSQEKLSNMLLPMPPLAEQERIVDKLDRIVASM